MRTLPLLSLTLLASLALAGCSSTPSEPAKPPAARVALGLFKNTDASTVKNNLMSVCSKSRLNIQTDKNEVICTSTEIDSQRETLITAMINNEYALQYKDVVSFVLAAQGPDVRVTANSYLEFIMPKGIMSDVPAKSTRNLLDDASFINAQKLLKAAGASE